MFVKSNGVCGDFTWRLSESVKN